MMGYIVDLTISEDVVDLILKKFSDSGNHARVHNEIRAFVGDTNTLRLGDSDRVLDEIVRLIGIYCVEPQ